MGSVANPILASMTGINPTGNQTAIANPITSQPAVPGANPLLPTVNTSPNSTNTNPYSVVPSAPVTSTANSGPYSSTGGSLLPATGTNATGGAATNPFGIAPGDWNKMWNEMKKTYGAGTAETIIDFLKGGAGYNQQAINNLLASLQPGIERGEENIMEQFSATGNRFGSPAATGLGDFLSQVNLNEGNLVTQMYEQSLTNFMNVLMGTSDKTSDRIANSPSTADDILGGLGILQGAGKSALSALGM